MPWARIDDDLYDHPKVSELLEEPEGWGALGFWIAMLSWAHRHTRKRGKTPGFLPRADVARMDRSQGIRFAGLLVKVGMWELAEGGWKIHDFDHFLPSEKKLSAQALNGAKGGLAKAANRRQREEDIATGQDELATGYKKLATAKPSSSHALGTGIGSTSTRGSPIAEGGVGGGTKLATRIPDNFRVTPEMVQWAKANVPHVDGRLETAKFTDHFKAASGANARKKDWIAAWRNWMRTADQRLSQGSNGYRPQPAKLPQDEDGFWRR